MPDMARHAGGRLRCSLVCLSFFRIGRRCLLNPLVERRNNMSLIKNPVFVVGAFVVLLVVGLGMITLRAKNKLQPVHPYARLVGASIPDCRYIGTSGAPLDNAKLRTGKVLLVLMSMDCGACTTETAFLKSVVNPKSGLRYIGVLIFPTGTEILKAAQAKYPFELHYDENLCLFKDLRTKAVPLKLYLEDGVIRKFWSGATSTPEEEREFKAWLASIE